MSPDAGARLAYFISAHGFGHAARAAAVMNALAEQAGAIHFEIFTEAPRWFFDDALPGVSFSIHPTKTDIGLVQKSPMEHDLDATLLALDRFLPFDEDALEANAGLLQRLRCKGVLCDIAPLGIAVAERANIPSILIENFTWDWIYEEYVETHPRLAVHNRYLKQVFEGAQFHIQTAPLCSADPDASLTTFPVSRKARHEAQETRARLRIPPGESMVLITMGGIEETFKNLAGLQNRGHFHFVIPGGHSRYEWNNHLVLLPHHSDFYHPDLIRAADIIIGKAGYSTIAEVYQAGKPFGFISRPGFRESAPLREFIQREIKGIEIPEKAYRQNEWLEMLPALRDMPLMARQTPNGADQIAAFVISTLNL